ncbi:MAG: glycosyltransferase family 9 protein [Alphaproteobacteria bacterium]|nr:glycosyltransferase family 9 protein [Alphaproteobacteria bacterium]
MRNILVIKHGAFGDFMQAMGCLQAIRHHHPHHHITLMTTKPFEALARASGTVDNVYIDSRPKWYRLGAWAALKRWLNVQNFTFVYDLQNSERTAFYLTLFKDRPQWSGIAKGASHAVPDDGARKSKHVFQALVDQLAVAGITPVSVDTLEWIEADTSGLDVPPRYALVVAGCSAKHLAKRWPHERYAEVCGWFAARGVTPVLLGTKDEADVTAAIKTACPVALDLTGRTTLMQIAVLARGAVCAIGNDTGPIHMIAPTGCKTLGLYPAFSNPQRHGPLGAHVRTIQQKTMADISTGQVFIELEKMIA